MSSSLYIYALPVRRPPPWIFDFRSCQKLFAIVVTHRAFYGKYNKTVAFWGFCFLDWKPPWLNALFSLLNGRLRFMTCSVWNQLKHKQHTVDDDLLCENHHQNSVLVCYTSRKLDFNALECILGFGPKTHNIGILVSEEMLSVSPVTFRKIHHSFQMVWK